MQSTHTRFIQIFSCLVIMLASFQAKAVLLTFDEPGVVNGSSAETFYASSGVTFSGGGLLADGPGGVNPGQPIFFSGAIGTFTKTLGAQYEDSFFDIWVHFDVGAASASGDYYGNTEFGGSVEAYDAVGNLLDSITFPALPPPNSSFGLLQSFAFGGYSSAIKKLHLISEDARAVSLLDNLEFSAVPVPAAVWLFGSALLGLLGWGKRRKAAAGA